MLEDFQDPQLHLLGINTIWERTPQVNFVNTRQNAKLCYDIQSAELDQSGKIGILWNL